MTELKTLKDLRTGSEDYCQRHPENMIGDDGWVKCCGTCPPSIQKPYASFEGLRVAAREWVAGIDAYPFYPKGKCPVCSGTGKMIKNEPLVGPFTSGSCQKCMGTGFVNDVFFETEEIIKWINYFFNLEDEVKPNDHA